MTLNHFGDDLKYHHHLGDDLKYHHYLGDDLKYHRHIGDDLKYHHHLGDDLKYHHHLGDVTSIISKGEGACTDVDSLPRGGGSRGSGYYGKNISTLTLFNK